MSQLVVLNLGKGNWQQGFPTSVAQLWQTDSHHPMQFSGGLPAAPELEALYRRWQQMYETLYFSLGWRHLSELELEPEFEIDEADLTHVSQEEFERLCQELQQSLNAWLNAELFHNIERQLRTRLVPTDEIRFIITAESEQVLRLPWCLWHFFADYPKAEIALSPQEYSYSRQAFPVESGKKVRILAVLGDRRSIDVDRDRQLLEQLSNTELKLLVEPSRLELTQQLWESNWDIFFFAGHSSSRGKGRMQLNRADTLTIDQLRYGLRQAIAQGLKLAIFNSCDGLGLARDLADLHIPGVIVMREPVSDQVAQEFLKHFLIAFSKGQSLYRAVREARERLQALEDKFPCASWLPVICQNPAVEPPTWLQLGGVLPCPYRGLFSFQEEDAHLFFGREQFIQELVAAVNTKPLVAVVGPSGSGKSSVVFAGLVPQLRRKEQGLLPPEIVTFRPGNNPFEALAAALADSCHIIKELINPTMAGRMADALRQDDKTLSGIVNRLKKVSAVRLILIVDQFEELYTLCPQPERQPFLDTLLEAMKLAPAFTLVLTLRADFYGAALSYRPLSDALQGATYNLGAMSRSELQLAIAEPATRMHVRLEPELIERLIDAVWGQPGRLPLLEFALTQLWSKQRQGWLTHQAYLEIGGVEAALANHAETVYDQFSEADKQRVQQVFVQLVGLGKGMEATRRLATRDEVKEENWNLVVRLASSRLVVTNHNDATGSETVEIVHEALIRNWGRLGQWLRSDGEFRGWQEQLRIARRQWESSGSDEGALLRGKPLVDAEYWLQHRLPELSERDRDFIKLSLALRKRELEKQKRKRQLTISVLICGLIGALILSGVALWQWQSSVISESEAISRAATLLSASDREFEALTESISAGRKLQQAVFQFHTAPLVRHQVVTALIEAVYGVREQNRLQGHQGAVYSVSFSPDGQTLASASADKTVKLWHKDGSAFATLTGHKGEVHSVSFSPDGQTLASASADKTVKLWSRDGILLKTLLGSNSPFLSVSFSSDGQMLAATSANGLIQIWHKDGELLKSWFEEGVVYQAIFSPNGRSIASAGGDTTVKLWNLDGTTIQTYQGHTDGVFGLAFSPDSQTLASASADGTIALWQRNGIFSKTLLGHDGAAQSVVFSPDGQIASANANGTLELWRPDGALLKTLHGHTDLVHGLSFSPDGQTLASASWDKTIKLWRKDGTLVKTLEGHKGRVYAAIFSPDGQLIASASGDGIIKLWHRDGTLLKTLR
ncbi:MAG: CHAT domain-containing protein, partial [Chroococcidiopsidaceae cyanobacterium CP_BM_RX_35]|nr:CHAT domain-containing protein [Chroococcidiopsidaceae cyanobacterium CP_BM_RX_35]